VIAGDSDNKLPSDGFGKILKEQIEILKKELNSGEDESDTIVAMPNVVTFAQSSI
jgi:hypothetical protein